MKTKVDVRIHLNLSGQGFVADTKPHFLFQMRLSNRHGLTPTPPLNSGREIVLASESSFRCNDDCEYPFTKP